MDKGSPNLSLLTGAETVSPHGDSLTFRDLLISQVKAHPFASYVERQRTGVERGLTVREMWRRAQSLALWVQTEEPAPERPWVLVMDHTQDLTIALWAAILLERDVILWHVVTSGSSDQRLQEKASRIARQFPDAWVITESTFLKQAPFLQQSPFCDALVLADAPLLPEDRPLPHPPGRTPNLYIETSGTTGEPKFGVLPFHRWAERYSRTDPPPTTDCRLDLLPFDTITGVAAALPVHRRLILVHPDRFASHPLDLFHMAEQHGATHLLLTTTFAEHLLNALSRTPVPFRLSRLRCVSFGLEQIVEDTLWRFADALNGMTDHTFFFRCGCGMTETGILAISEPCPPELILPARGSHDPVPVGGCAQGKQLRIVDDASRILPAGTPGWVEAKCPFGLLEGYLLPDQSIQPPDLQDGWLHTGDLGKIESGQLTLLGRRKSVLISGGRKIPLSAYDHEFRSVTAVHQPYVTAVTLTDPITRTDRLVVVYAPAPNSRLSSQEVEAILKEAAFRVAPVPVDRMVPLEATLFPFTQSGKLRRLKLAELIEEIETASSSFQSREAHPDNDLCNVRGNIETALVNQWNNILPHCGSMSRDTHFFEAGGNSLSAASMLVAVECEFSRRVPLESFFRNPTLGHLADLLKGTPSDPLDMALSSREMLVSRQLDLLQAWPGTTTYTGSFWRHLHPEGDGPTLVWVFQYPEEASALADSLGNEIQVLATHSWHTLVNMAYLDSPLVESLTDRMLWDLLGQLGKGPVFLGGNCQGGLVALSLARKLAQMGLAPERLFLQEWSFPARRYEHPVHIIYGKQSPVSTLYEKPDHAGSGWQDLFPDVCLEPIDVAHGAFFQPDHIRHLANVIRSVLQPSTPNLPLLQHIQKRLLRLIPRS